MKICKRCQVEKDLSFFSLSNGYRASYCKSCQSLFMKEWRIKNADYVKEKSSEKYKRMTPDQKRKQKYLNRYRIDLNKYNEMVSEQNGVCKICHKPCSSRKYLSVDHCHKTGVVRGLLCLTCNNMLQRANDDSSFFNRALQYLKFYEIVNDKATVC